MRPKRQAALAARAAAKYSGSSSPASEVIVISDSEDAFSPPKSRTASPSPSLASVASEPSIATASEDDEPRGKKRKRVAAVPRASRPVGDIEDLVRPHASSYHSTADVASAQDALLNWFEEVRWVGGVSD